MVRVSTRFEAVEGLAIQALGVLPKLRVYCLGSRGTAIGILRIWLPAFGARVHGIPSS